MTLVGWFSLLAGIAIAGLWVALLTRRAVPEIAAGDTEIWFHIAAELVTAALLVVGGVALLAGEGAIASILAAFALGALLSTSIASAGYYAARGERRFVAAFGLVTAASIAAGVALLATS